MNDRKSEASEPDLIADPIARARREAENALTQFDWGMDEVERWIADGKPNLRTSILLRLHRLALDGISPYAGNFRPASVAIRGSKHTPIAADDVPRYVEEMFDYVIENWEKKTALHLASYVMWRLNWIHPFSDGNGRTSRILSYMILCGKLGTRLPGVNTIPEQISTNKSPYYDALEAADEVFKRGSVDVSEMESLLEGYLANQLVNLHEQALGREIVETSKGETGPRKFSLIRGIEAHPVLSGGIFLLFATLLGIAFS